MHESFATILAVGGKTNSLGRAHEVIAIILRDKTRLDELYACLFADDAWVRMRAADVLEKICREHPEWLLSFIDRIQKDLSASAQPSIQWHIAQIYAQVTLTDAQKSHAILWLQKMVATKDVDWIVSANVMETLAQFVDDGSVARPTFISLVKVQQHHKSPTVVKRAGKWLAQYAD
jgi:TPR repeat protein